MVNLHIQVVGTGATEEEACRMAMVKMVRACALVNWSATDDTLLHLIFCLQQDHKGAELGIRSPSAAKDLGLEAISAG